MIVFVPTRFCIVKIQVENQTLIFIQIALRKYFTLIKEKFL